MLTCKWVLREGLAGGGGHSGYAQTWRTQQRNKLPQYMGQERTKFLQTTTHFATPVWVVRQILSSQRDHYMAATTRALKTAFETLAVKRFYYLHGSVPTAR
jgi:hypothetical protein